MNALRVAIVGADVAACASLAQSLNAWAAGPPGSAHALVRCDAHSFLQRMALQAVAAPWGGDQATRRAGAEDTDDAGRRAPDIVAGPPNTAATAIATAATSNSAAITAVAAGSHPAATTHGAAADHLATYGLTLLLAHEGAGPAATAEHCLRTALGEARVPFQVLYGDPPARLRLAIAAIELYAARNARAAGSGGGAPAVAAQRLLGVLPARPGEHTFEDGPANGPQRLRAWGCEKCSDPVCEHALFQRLLQSR